MRALHLKQQFVEYHPGLGCAPHHLQQHTVADSRFGPGEEGDGVVFLQRLVKTPDFAQYARMEQVALGRLKVGPALLQIVQRRQRIRLLIATEFGLRLAQRIGRLPAHRQRKDMIVVARGLVEPSDLQAFGGKRRAIGNRIGVGEPIG